MTSILFHATPATRRRSLILRAALLTQIFLAFNAICFAQTENIPPASTKTSGAKPLTSDERSGVNWFPWKNKVVRWNNEWLYLYKSPVGYSSVPFALGGKGSVFHSTLELAF